MRCQRGETALALLAAAACGCAALRIPEPLGSVQDSGMFPSPQAAAEGQAPWKVRPALTGVAPALGSSTAEALLAAGEDQWLGPPRDEDPSPDAGVKMSVAQPKGFVDLDYHIGPSPSAAPEAEGIWPGFAAGEGLNLVTITGDLRISF